VCGKSREVAGRCQHLQPRQLANRSRLSHAERQADAAHHDAIREQRDVIELLDEN